MKIHVRKVCLADADIRKNIKRWHIKIRRDLFHPNLRVLKLPKTMYYRISNLFCYQIYDGIRHRPVGLIINSIDGLGFIVTFYSEKSKNLPVDNSVIKDEEETINKQLY